MTTELRWLEREDGTKVLQMRPIASMSIVEVTTGREFHVPNTWQAIPTVKEPEAKE